MPDRWVDALFQRFAVMYGRHWLDLWANIPMAEVKAAWSEQLGNLHREQIRQALEHVSRNNRFPPTLPEFYGIASGMVRPVENCGPGAEIVTLLTSMAIPMPEHIREQLRQFVARAKGTG